jgi:hypothetical protein
MSPNAEPPGQASGDEGGSGDRRREPPRDLIDFFRRWPEFRETAIALARRAELSAVERETVNWLVLLVDRIGERDIGPSDCA